MFGGAKRYHDAYTRAEWAFAQAQREHELREAAQQAKVTEARATWKRTVTEERRTIEAHNAQIEKIEVGRRKAVEPTPWPPAGTRRLYQSAIAQIA